jgi:anti-sigma factor RsiW
VIGHLGARVSALLDGQLPPAEAEEAWAHVYTCHACRDLVEREGWVKTRLAGLSGGQGAAPDDLKGSLLSLTPGEQYLVASRGSGNVRRRRPPHRSRGGAVGAAMLGVLALGFAPGSTPPGDRRPPASRVETPVVSDGADRQAPDTGSVPAGVPAWVRQLMP